MNHRSAVRLLAMLAGVAISLCAAGVCVTALAQSLPAASAHGAGRDQPDPADEAMRMYMARKVEEAKTHLSDFVKTMPQGWKAYAVTQGKLQRYYWSLPDFLQCSASDRTAVKVEEVIWPIGPSYAKAHFFLGYIASGERRYDEALRLLDVAATLEPDSPPILNERGQVLLGLGRAREALESYRAASRRGCIRNQQLAVALRGQGVALVELRQFDEAEAVLNQSLTLEPGNALAMSELQIIQGLRAGNAMPGMVPAK